MLISVRRFRPIVVLLHWDRTTVARSSPFLVISVKAQAHTKAMAGDGRRSIASRVLVRLFRPGYYWIANELGYRSCSGDFAGRRLRVEIIATGGNMRLGDIKNIMSHISLDKLMLQLKLVVPVSSHFSFIDILLPSPVAASTSIVCGRCSAQLMGMVRIVGRRANASSTKCRLF